MTSLYKMRNADGLHRPWKWRRLVHVCRRWRSVVFGSSVSLDLRLVCGPRTRVELTGIWPPLPIIITDRINRPVPEDYGFAAAIVHPNRVCELNLVHLTRSQLPRLISAMQEPFPSLIHLKLCLDNGNGRPVLALPDGFLGGYASRLQSLELDSIPFPALPKLLLSATDLVLLTLWNIPYFEYISSEAMVAGLAASAYLKYLAIKFESTLSHPRRESRRPPPRTRTVLPALTRFVFHGLSNYLEDLVGRIDTPMLDSIEMTFFHQVMVDLPQLGELMGRTTSFQALNEAHVHYDFNGIQVESFPPIRSLGDMSGLRISCRVYRYSLSYLVKVIASFFPSIYIAEHLYIYGPRNLSLIWQDDIEYMELSHPFSSVRNLYICEGFTECIAPAVQYLQQDLELDVTDLLPFLESLYLEELQLSGPVQGAIGQFVAARQLLGRPVAVSSWER